MVAKIGVIIMTTDQGSYVDTPFIYLLGFVGAFYDVNVQFVQDKTHCVSTCTIVPNMITFIPQLFDTRLKAPSRVLLPTVDTAHK